MYTLLELQAKTFGELKKIGDELNVCPEGDRRCRQSWIDAIAGVNPPLLQLLEFFPGVEVDRAQEQIIETVETSPAAEAEQVQEPPLESKFGRIVYPRPAQGAIEPVAENSPGVEVDLVSEAIVLVAETSPGVEVDRVQDIINKTWTSWEKEQCAWLASAKWCVHRGENKRIETFLPVSKTLRLEGMKQGTEYCAIWEVSECVYDFDGFPLPVCSSLYAQVPIVLAVKTSPGVEVDPVSEAIVPVAEYFPDNDAPKCSECFDDGFIQDEFGCVKTCQCNEPKLSHKKTQSAIVPATKISKSDQNSILTGIVLSDRFLARYASPQAQTLHHEITDGYKVDTDGQLSFLEAQVVSEPEPPDPDDFESPDAFREAIARWDWEHPSSFDHCSEPSSVQNEPLEVSLDSFCEWAPCPADWYEPDTSLDQSKVSELLRAEESSITSDFFIPTFDRLGDLRNDEPPDTGIFAKLPGPKPPKFPPRASQPKSGQGSPSHGKSAKRPETIPKLFSRVAAGSSTQPARSPPGGDA
jgi:hypothetical protein